MLKKNLLSIAVAAPLAGALLLPTSALALDTGELFDKYIASKSRVLFGFSKPLAESADSSVPRATDLTPATLPQNSVTSFGGDASAQIELAKGLKATYLTRIAADWTDMMTFWDENGDGQEDYIISCVEHRVPTADIDGTGTLAPSVQRINLGNGAVDTILRGMKACDGIRTTPWGTVLVTEETSDGQAYEIIDPIHTDEVVLIDRAAGTLTGADAGNVAKRPALPMMSWEGLTVTAEGVVIAGDELRPGDWDKAGDGGDDPDVDGGAIFKFIPDAPHSGGPLSDLDYSPLVAGSVYAMRVSCREGSSSSFNVNYGQGCEVGNAAWIPVDAATARADADSNGATGYYRPEDLHADPTYDGEGVRFCWANTGREKAQNYGEVLCGIDRLPLATSGPEGDLASVVVNRFVEGDSELNSVDNLAFQPGTGILYIIEDHDFGDVWACLPDGGDRDIKSDGCVRVLSVASDGDNSEPTGFIFSPDGSKAYVAIQHSGINNAGARDVNGDGRNDTGACDSDINNDGIDDCQYDHWDTDDVIVISGFKPVKARK